MTKEFHWKNLLYYYNNPIEKLSEEYTFGKHKSVDTLGLGKIKIKNKKLYFKGIAKNSHCFYVQKIKGNNGKGKIYNNNFDLVYDGETKDRNFDGKGKIFSKTATFEGEFEQGKMKKGLLSLESGATYEGEFKNEKRDGYGIYKYCGGSIYLGFWKQNERLGFSTMRSRLGWIYIGNYEKNKRNGKGTLYWPDGDSFEGFWVNNNRKGKGKFINFLTKEEIEQEWDEKDADFSQKLPEKFP